MSINVECPACLNCSVTDLASEISTCIQLSLNSIFQIEIYSWTIFKCSISNESHSFLRLPVICSACLRWIDKSDTDALFSVYFMTNLRNLKSGLLWGR